MPDAGASLRALRAWSGSDLAQGGVPETLRILSVRETTWFNIEPKETWESISKLEEWPRWCQGLESARWIQGEAWKPGSRFELIWQPWGGGTPLWRCDHARRSYLHCRFSGLERTPAEGHLLGCWERAFQKSGALDDHGGRRRLSGRIRVIMEGLGFSHHRTACCALCRSAEGLARQSSRNSRTGG